MLLLSVVFFNISLFLFITANNNLVIIWTTLLLSTLSLLSNMKEQPTDTAFKYFAIQETASLLFLLSNSLFSTHTSLLLLLFKMGLPPFHLWALEIIQTINKKTTLWFLNISKLIPFIISINLISSPLAPLMFISFFLSQLFSLMTRTEMKSLMLFSSFSNLSWSMILSLLSHPLAILFFGLYIYFSLLSLWPKETQLWEQTDMNPMLTMNLLTLPPSIMFFIKLQSMLLLSTAFFTLTFLALISSSLFYYTYFQIMETNTTMHNFLYTHKTKPKMPVSWNWLTINLFFLMLLQLLL